MATRTAGQTVNNSPIVSSAGSDCIEALTELAERYQCYGLKKFFQVIRITDSQIITILKQTEAGTV